MSDGPLMHLRARVMDPSRKDDISEALHKASPMEKNPYNPKERHRRDSLPVYLVNHYEDGLREITLGPQARELVGVSRYYRMMDPPVVVDFEPEPPEKWFFEEKQRLFTERGILYLGIALTDRLTDEEFIERYRTALIGFERAQEDLRADRALAEATAEAHADVDVEDVLMTPEFDVLLTRLAHLQAAADRDKINRPLRGFARTRRAATYKITLVDQYRGKLRAGMGTERCHRELTEAIERQGEGQVHPPVAC